MHRPLRSTLPTLAALALAACSLAACGDDEPEPTSSGPASATSPAPSTGSATESAAPEPTAVGSIWVTSADAGAVFQVDPATGELVSTVDATDLYPFDVVAGFDSAWVLTGYEGVKRLDPTLPDPVDIPVDSPQGIVVGDDSVWVTTGDGDLVPIDPVTNQPGEPVALGEDVLPDSMVWLDGTIIGENSYDSSVVAIDPATGVTGTTERDDVVFRGVGDDGTAWFGGFGGVFGYDATGAEVETFPSDDQVSAVAADPDSDAMWVGYSDGTVATLDPATGEYGEPVAVGDTYVGDLQLAGGVLWAAIEGGSLYGLDPVTLEVQSEVALPGAEGAAAIAVG